MDFLNMNRKIYFGCFCFFILPVSLLAMNPNWNYQNHYQPCPFPFNVPPYAYLPQGYAPDFQSYPYAPEGYSYDPQIHADHFARVTSFLYGYDPTAHLDFLVEQNELAKEMAFKHEIFRRVRIIIAKWRAKKLLDVQDSYWQIRMVVERNLDLFRNANNDLYEELIYNIETSRLLGRVKKKLTCLLRDYRFRYDETFDIYHYYDHEGIVHLCHRSPHDPPSN